MSAILPTRRAAATSEQSEVAHPVSEFIDATETLYRLTIDEYEQIGEHLLDRRVELIDGFLVAKMVQKPPHVVACELVGTAIRGKTPAGSHVREAKPFRVPVRSEPEPDFVVVRGQARDFVDRHPQAAAVALVIEVADSSLPKGRRRRRTYGSSGIPIYWIVNLHDRQVEVYAQPTANGYESRANFKAGQEVPLVIGGAKVGHVPVADILPRRPVRPSATVLEGNGLTGGTASLGPNISQLSEDCR